VTPFVLMFIQTDYIQITDYESNWKRERESSIFTGKLRGRITHVLVRECYLRKHVWAFFMLARFPAKHTILPNDRYCFSFLCFSLIFLIICFVQHPLVFCPTQDFLASSSVGTDIAINLRYVPLFLTLSYCLSFSQESYTLDLHTRLIIGALVLFTKNTAASFFLPTFVSLTVHSELIFPSSHSFR